MQSDGRKRTLFSSLGNAYFGDEQRTGSQKVRSCYFWNSFWHLVLLNSKNGPCNPCFSVGCTLFSQLSCISKATGRFLLFPVTNAGSLIVLWASQVDTAYCLLGILCTIAWIPFKTQCLVRWDPQEQPCLISIINVLGFVTLSNFQHLFLSP